MSLYSDYNEWLSQLQSLLEEGEDLSRRVNALEEENISLQHRLMNSTGQASGFEALSNLYDEGYHICPADYGHTREDDCIFCLNFLHHKGNKE